MSEDLRGLYEKYFDILHEVDGDEELVAESYRLRYQVYCLEHGYENPEEFPEGKETDVFDERSCHSLLVHRPTGIVAGSVRLIWTDPGKVHDCLPIDGLCVDAALHDELVLPRKSLVEASRFAVSKDFRKRLDDAKTPSGVGEEWRESTDERRKIPHISLGLFQAMICVCHRYGITHWVAEMEPALLRMLSQLGIHFVNIGPVVEFHGRRQPCYIYLSEMLRRNKLERRDVWELITAGGKYDCQ